MLRAIKWKGDGSVQSGSYIQGHHIFKNIWNHAVLERLNYDPYTSHQPYSKNTNNGWTITVCDDVISWHIDRTPTTVWIVFNSSKIWHDVASTGYKNHYTCCSLTVWQLHKLQLSHIKLFYSTGVGRTRLQLAKVVVASVWVQDVQKGFLKVNACVKMYWCTDFPTHFTTIHLSLS